MPRAADPLWYKDAVIYQAHVRSFFDANNDGVGDFEGLTQKLDYLQALGITCIWLLPFFPSPLKDDGYDISDYLSVHPSYGTLADFKAFVTAAHERDIKVLIELVVNHTSDQHPWFERARHAPPGSAERNFYVWSDTDRKFPETRIIFSDTEKSNWAWDPVAKQYYWHRFFSHQPDLNHNNPAVVDAVFDVMRFWLDLDVDGFRLDAVAYLCVREGTNNENLSETHAVLRRIRRLLDASYPNRVLLGEVNQWPADVRPYFGDGDECHMAFHFPLMPRMFMALRQEDRHAITEILDQTPEIPDRCQWALFLRNHDELTLEMVTDEERDYMYQSYAADPQMLINGGIRRRLAPLLENSRRRVELLNNLLFSLPGTPIVYYGDEIGMGDNIYLGDRNGVRTPMQWSSDRNGGFSRADPARLSLPPIMDSVFGYQAINVEAQERYPFSLLNWMKRLIALRKQHPVLARGSLEFIPASNRKILAFLRRNESETVFVVANLSRSLQPVELDLRAFDGLIPFEMVGQTDFPRIGDRPYFMTLGPYASYWFALHHAPQQAALRAAPADAAADFMEALPALLVGTNWETLLDAATRTTLERQALVPFLARQPWLVSKSRQIKQARFSDWSAIRGGSHPAFVAITSVSFTDGWHETYQVPLAFASGELAARVARESPKSIVARITGARKGILIDGLQDDDVCDRLLGMVESCRDLATGRGRVRPEQLATLAPVPERRWVRATNDDDNNSVVSVSDRYVLKVIRRIEPGLHPELEIPTHLANRGFTRAPSLAGAILYERPGLDPGALAIVQQAIRHQGSGWNFTIDDLHRYYERVQARVRRTDDPPSYQGINGQPPPFFAALEALYLVSAETLGRRTAELHAALAAGGSNGFEPEPFDDRALGDTERAMASFAAETLDRLRDRVNTLPDPVSAAAADVLARRQALLERFEAIGHLTRAGQRIRIHGDYHLGQVLRTEEDFFILDFEGDPARSLSDRRAKQSPLKDVAGMIRSFSYAAYAGLIAFTRNAPADYRQLEPWADTWQRWTSQSFLNGYRSIVQPSPLLPDPPAFDALLRAYILDKGLHELAYELTHRPDWVGIPLTGIMKAI
jgi:maltose alpha-D-glucosyltransferase/alpha-amylase